MSETTTERCYQTEELRVEPPEIEGGRPRIVGLAIPFGALSEDLGGFRERFLPGSLTESIASGDIRADVEHDEDKRLGRTSKGTLSLKETKRGLQATITVPDTTVGHDALEDVRNGNLDAMSIEFTKPQRTFTGRGGKIVAEVKRATLKAVTLTSFPAYRQTAGTLSQRSLDEYRSTIEEEDDKATEEDTAKHEETRRLQDRAERDPCSIWGK